MTGKRNVYTIVLGASAAIASLAGLLYSISQSFSFGSVVDPFFVGLLIANNFIIWRAVKYFSDRLIDEGTNAAIPGEPRGIVETATRRMNHTGYGLAVGIAFGVLYAPAPFITEGVWESAPEMRLYLSAFLVLSNHRDGNGPKCVVLVCSSVNSARRSRECSALELRLCDCRIHYDERTSSGNSRCCGFSFLPSRVCCFRYFVPMSSPR